MIYRRVLPLSILLGLLLLAACGGSAESVAPAAEIDLGSLPDTVDVQTTAQLQENDDVVLLDVREQWEYDEGHIPGVTLIPMNEVAGRMSEIPTDKTVILTCRSGNRGGQVADFLRSQGYDNVHNMAGGILAWEAAGLPVDQ